MNEFREADREETGFVSRSIGRLFRLVGGEDVDVALRPVLFVTVCGALAFSSLWSFVGIWAKTSHVHVRLAHRRGLRVRGSGASR